MAEKRTKLENYERQAMAGDRTATLQVIAALRHYRLMVKNIMDSPHVDLPDHIADAWEVEINRIEEAE